MQPKIMTAMATILALTTLMPEAASARPHHHRYYRYHHRCRGGNGAVGTVAGGVGGAVIADAVIGGPVAVVAGGVGGALLGRHLDKQHTRHRHGC